MNANLAGAVPLLREPPNVFPCMEVDGGYTRMLAGDIHSPSPDRRPTQQRNLHPAPGRRGTFRHDPSASGLAPPRSTALRL